MTKIKICGLRRPEDITYANTCHPDYIGFVFYPPSSRYVTPGQAAKLRKSLASDIQAVGVFVNEPFENILRLCLEGTIDLIQLHGNETAEDICFLKSRTDVPIIKALRVQTREQLMAAKSLPCDYLLLDTCSGDTYGGSGKSFDHSLIPSEYPDFFLAGGLNKENIADSIQNYHPYAVDLSSSVETEGFKDENKIKEIIEIVRRSDAQLSSEAESEET